MQTFILGDAASILPQRQAQRGLLLYRGIRIVVATIMHAPWTTKQQVLVSNMNRHLGLSQLNKGETDCHMTHGTDMSKSTVTTWARNLISPLLLPTFARSSTTLAIEHLSNWKKRRGCIRNLSNIYRTGKKRPRCIRNLSNIYRTSIEHGLNLYRKVYRTAIENISNIYRKSIEHVSKIYRTSI